MRNWFREGFYGSLSVALCVALFLMWLWRPERQVNRHAENFLRAMEGKDWSRAAEFIADNYTDQWGNDHALVLARTRQVFQYLRNIELIAHNPTVRIDNGLAHWQSRITIDGEGGEVMALIKERVNPLTTPFDLEWRRFSKKPWDWKLVRVTNAELVIPEYAY